MVYQGCIPVAVAMHWFMTSTAERHAWKAQSAASQGKLIWLGCTGVKALCRSVLCCHCSACNASV